MAKELSDLIELTQILASSLITNEKQMPTVDLELTIPDVKDQFNKKDYEAYTTYSYSAAPACYYMRGCVRVQGGNHMLLFLVLGSGQHDDSLPWPVKLTWTAHLLDRDNHKEWQVGKMTLEFEKPTRGFDNSLGWHTGVILTRQELEDSILVACDSMGIRWRVQVESKLVQTPSGDRKDLTSTCEDIMALACQLQTNQSASKHEMAVKEVVNENNSRSALSTSSMPPLGQRPVDEKILMLEIRALRDETRDLKQQLQNQHNQKQEDVLRESMQDLRKLPTPAPIEDRHFSNVSFEWKITGIRKLLEDGGDVYSDNFSTGPRGYKIQAVAGFKNGAMTTINLFVCNSEHDPHLQWPVNFHWSLSVYDHDGHFQRERKIAERVGQCTQRPEYGRVRQVGLRTGNIDPSYGETIRADSVKNDAVLLRLVAKIC